MPKFAESILINSIYNPFDEKQTFRLQNITLPEISDIIDMAKLHHLHWDYDIKTYSCTNGCYKITNFTVYGNDNDIEEFSEWMYNTF